MVSLHLDTISNQQSIHLCVSQSRQLPTAFVLEGFHLQSTHNSRCQLLMFILDNKHEYVVDCVLLEHNTFE